MHTFFFVHTRHIYYNTIILLFYIYIFHLLNTNKYFFTIYFLLTINIPTIAYSVRLYKFYIWLNNKNG